MRLTVFCLSVFGCDDSARSSWLWQRTELQAQAYLPSRNKRTWGI